jgi:hypothetical protein
MALTVRAKFVLRKVNILPLPAPLEGPPQITDLRPPLAQSVEVTVTVKAVNALLVNSTIRDVAGSGNMAGYTLADEYYWGRVSPQMAAAGKDGLSNIAALPGTRHSRAQLLADDRFPLATAWMNSSHGTSGGVSGDRPDPSTGMDDVTWGEVASRTGRSNASADRKLQLNTVLLYSCDCGKAQNLGTTLFGAPINQVAFAFPGTIFTMLKGGDATPELPLTDANGILLLTGKLTSHVTALTSYLMAGSTAELAASTANEDFPPRTYSRRDPANTAINLMRILNISPWNDVNATAKGVYKPSDSSSYVAYGPSLIVFR